MVDSTYINFKLNNNPSFLFFNNTSDDDDDIYNICQLNIKRTKMLHKLFDGVLYTLELVNYDIDCWPTLYNLGKVLFEILFVIF